MSCGLEALISSLKTHMHQTQGPCYESRQIGIRVTVTGKGVSSLRKFTVKLNIPNEFDLLALNGNWQGIKEEPSQDNELYILGPSSQRWASLDRITPAALLIQHIALMAHSAGPAPWSRFHHFHEPFHLNHSHYFLLHPFPLFCTGLCGHVLPFLAVPPLDSFFFKYLSKTSPITVLWSMTLLDVFFSKPGWWATWMIILHVDMRFTWC